MRWAFGHSRKKGEPNLVVKKLEHRFNILKSIRKEEKKKIKKIPLRRSSIHKFKSRGVPAE